MLESIRYFRRLLHTAFALFLNEKSDYSDIRIIPAPESDWLTQIVGRKNLTFEEQSILLLALMPHICPESLDLFFIRNKSLDRPFTEFGGREGDRPGGFLPTGETAAFILCMNRPEVRRELFALFDKPHWFFRENILRLEPSGEGEPLLSGRLLLSDDLLSRVLFNRPFRPEYAIDFPAKRITTDLDFDELILPYRLKEELESISVWLQRETEIRNRWRLDRIVKPGYRCLFYGPPGTGKTLTAALLGKRHGLDIYRIDLSQIVSKYIGETEKNLGKIFDQAEHHNWILFFDEADALFGKRTQTNSSNDRYANQEVAYLLQRIEDFPGITILATNMKENIDEAFLRRFQSIIYYPLPDEKLRFRLWENMLPSAWLPTPPEEFLRFAAQFELSGGSIVNVVQSCAIRLYQRDQKRLTLQILKEAINKELIKEGKTVRNE